MNESETRSELIDPALQAVGWDVVEGSRIRQGNFAINLETGQEQEIAACPSLEDPSEKGASCEVKAGVSGKFVENLSLLDNCQQRTLGLSR
ncbi:MAG: hypothetical protein NTV29_02320 [Planctomycetota bacterium]|nr:hypothetical protein [Planctomycetota bacterium]